MPRSSNKNKVVIIGAGHVGSHCAYALSMGGSIQEIVFIDIDEKKAAAQADDITDALSFMPHPVVLRSGSYQDCSDAQIVLLAAGVPRKPGQTRLDTMGDSIKVMKDIVPKLNGSGFDGVLVCISNPVDVITTYMHRHVDLPTSRILGTGTSLDTARLKRILWKELEVHPASIHCYSLGEHGDSSMIPFSHVQIGGLPLQTLMDQYPKSYGKLDLDHVLQRTRTVGMDIINGKNSTEFGIGSVVADLVGSILHDERRILPLSCLLEGAYGQEGIAIGVPAIVGGDGIQTVLELDLTAEEEALFQASCEVVRNHVEMSESH
ncbi:L-lactate dehydrogenase [Alkalibacter rhizosphaerae]|uniref:L-lactate dehydrogenase n=1 Tax=Alkalibacter rhizosphaerae TaxID=2815577 RepID=A0A975AIF5_9FIRM|nr:L-lactate dehydrogenase [Alkalibacter rhizosphaerae]QSX09023.1 L-lactate dehydrogenase [Alkalibacter rhizosphaerae]